MRYLIIGNGITGVSAANLLRQRDDQAEIVLISDESPYPFARTALMWIYMRQLTPRSTEPYERWWWREQRLSLVQDRVTAIDTEARRLELRDGQPMDYDRLLLATGGSANMFGWPGQELEGVCNMCTLGDLQQLEAVRPRLQRAVVVGGGLIGVELAEMMVHDRVPVIYLIREPWYWDLVLSREEAELVHQRMRDHGVELVLGDEIVTIEDNGAGQVAAVVTKKQQRLPCQLVGIAVGVHSNTDLARAAGLDCERGILVDQRMETSTPGVFAAGDCAEVRRDGEANLAQKLWYTGIRQGRAAARGMLGDRLRYDPGIPYNAAQFFFLDYVNVGWMKLAPFAVPGRLADDAVPEAMEEYFCLSPGQPDSVRICYLPGAGDQVLGFSMLGSRWNAALLMRWIEQRRALGWVLEHLGEALFNEEFRHSRFARGGLGHA